MNERESDTGLQEAVLVLRHQVVLHLDTGRHSPALLLNQTEHVAEAVHYQAFVLLAGIGGTHHALTHHVVGIVGMHALLRVLQLPRQVHVVHRNLAQ